MNKNICVLFRSDEYTDIEAKKSIIDMMKYIEPEKFMRIRIYNDFLPDSAIVGEGICREFILRFVCENLYTTEKVYVSSIVDISHDMTEISIFVALMYLFGIEIYSTDEEDRLYPDEIYLDGIRKFMKERLNDENINFANVEDEKQICVIKVVWDVIMHMWEEFRKY